MWGLLTFFLIVSTSQFPELKMAIMGHEKDYSRISTFKIQRGIVELVNKEAEKNSKLDLDELSEEERLTKVLFKIKPIYGYETTVQVIKDVNSGKVQLGVIPSNTFRYYYAGLLGGKEYKNISVVTGLNFAYLFVMVYKNSGINSLSNLTDKTLLVGIKDSAPVLDVLTLLKEYDVDFSKNILLVFEPTKNKTNVYRVTDFDTSSARVVLKPYSDKDIKGKDHIEAFGYKEGDILFEYNPKDSELVKILIRDLGCKAISLDKALITSLVKRDLPHLLTAHLTKYEINKDQPTDVDTLAFRNVLIVNKNVATEIVYALTKFIYSEGFRGKIIKYDRLADQYLKKDMWNKYVPDVFHVGAKKFYEGKPLIVESPPFYTQDAFWGAVGVLLSIIAGIASYFAARKKKRKASYYINQIISIYRKNLDNPQKGIKELQEYREKIDDLFSQGKIDPEIDEKVSKTITYYINKLKEDMPHLKDKESHG